MVTRGEKSSAEVNDMLAALRQRAVRVQGVVEADADSEALTRALHEIDVYHAELEMQNEELRATQTQLSLARDRYRALFDEAPVAFVSVSRDGLVLDVNQAAVDLLGRPRERLLNRGFALSFEGLGEADCVRCLKLALEHTAVPPVEMALRRLSPSDPARVVELRCAAVGHGPTSTLLCHLTDVTKQRETEGQNRQLEHRLRESEKLEAVGRVAANIAHDVNNILVSVISLGDFVRLAVSEQGGSVRRDLDAMLDAAWRGARLMRGLLGLSRPAARSPHRVDIAQLLQQVATLQRHKKRKVEVQCAVSSSPLVVWGDEDELLQAFLNVATNGLESMEGGVLRLSAGRGAGSPALATITIEDQGQGMSEEVLAKAFEPLFTTKSAVGGSGLGLTLVHKTISGHGGQVQIDSTPGHGTKVTITLPLLNTEVIDRPSLERAVPEELQLSLLLVDDDDGVRNATARLLTAAGAQVKAFADGLTAFAALLKGLAFDVALVDVNMPGWSGPDLVERIVEKLGPRPIVFITGSSGELIPPHLLAQPYFALLTKPWNRRELEETIRRVFQNRPTAN